MVFYSVICFSPPVIVIRMCIPTRKKDPYKLPIERIENYTKNTTDINRILYSFATFEPNQPTKTGIFLKIIYFIFYEFEQEIYRKRKRKNPAF